MAKDDSSKVKVSEKRKSPTQLEGALKSKAVWVICVALVVMVTAILMSMPEAEQKETGQTTFDLNATGIDQQSWQVKAQAKLGAAADDARAARRSAEAADLRAQKTQDVVSQLTQSIQDLKRQLHLQGELSETQARNNADARKELRQTLTSDQDQAQTPSPVIDTTVDSGYKRLPLPLPPPPPAPPGARPAYQQTLPPFPGRPVAGGVAPAGPDAPIIFKPPTLTNSNAGSGVNNPDGPGVKVQYVKNDYAGYLPTGSFAPVVLLSGLDAAASAQTRANPQPVLMRVQANATTPGEASYAMNTCVIIGSAYGDMSSERAYIRLTRLSCVDPRNGNVIESEISGYVTDSDGFLGLRGKLVRRNGQLLAKAILSGFASALGDVASVVSRENARTITSVGGVGAETNSINLDAGTIAKAGAFGGAADAADMIAEYYLQQAQSIFPVISIPPGRKGTVVITEGTTLRWHSTRGQYIKKIVPNK